MLSEEEKTMVEIRKLVIEKLKNSIVQDEANKALEYFAILNEIPSYVDDKE